MKRGALASALQTTSLPASCEMVTGASDAAVVSHENLDSSTDSHENGDPVSAARGQDADGGSSRRQGRPAPASRGAKAKPLLSAAQKLPSKK